MNEKSSIVPLREKGGVAGGGSCIRLCTVVFVSCFGKDQSWNSKKKVRPGLKNKQNIFLF